MDNKFIAACIGARTGDDKPIVAFIAAGGEVLRTLTTACFHVLKSRDIRGCQLYRDGDTLAEIALRAEHHALLDVVR